MKKIAALTLSALLCLSLSAVAFADSSFITYTHYNDPSYTITIPDTIALSKEGTVVAIVASDVKDLSDKVIEVTIAGTNYYRNQMVLAADTRPSTSLRYSITTEDGSVYETFGNKDEVVGKVLAAFTDNGSSDLTFTPILKTDTVLGAEYSGTLTYGIAVI